MNWSRPAVDRLIAFHTGSGATCLLDSLGYFYDSKYLIRAARPKAGGTGAGESTDICSVRRVDAARAHPRA